MSEALGLDPDDPAVVAAMEACQPVLEDALPRPDGVERGDGDESDEADDDAADEAEPQEGSDDAADDESAAADRAGV